MHSTNYEKLLPEKLIPNLQPNPVTVVDNTPYYNVLYKQKKHHIQTPQLIGLVNTISRILMKGWNHSCKN
jgi:hypothetical protein